MARDCNTYSAHNIDFDQAKKNRDKNTELTTMIGRSKTLLKSCIIFIAIIVMIKITINGKSIKLMKEDIATKNKTPIIYYNNTLSLLNLKNINKNSNATIEMSTDATDASTNTNHINFKRDPNKFTSTLSNCMLDDSCKIIYHHIQKTGGKTVEYRMFHTFPYKYYHRKNIRCCFEKTMKEFSYHKKKLCKEKFTSYEVTSAEFEKIVRKCQKYNDKSRTVVLVSIRKPEDRTLSRINAFCNVRFEHRAKIIQEACLSCIYKDYQSVFDSFAYATNDAYNMALDTTKLNTNVGIQAVLSFDTYDIDNLFIMLQNENNIVFKNSTINSARHHRCTNFTMQPSLHEKLGPSFEIYDKIN